MELCDEDIGLVKLLLLLLLLLCEEEAEELAELWEEDVEVTKLLLLIELFEMDVELVKLLLTLVETEAKRVTCQCRHKYRNLVAAYILSSAMMTG